MELQVEQLHKAQCECQSHEGVGQGGQPAGKGKRRGGATHPLHNRNAILNQLNCSRNSNLNLTLTDRFFPLQIIQGNAHNSHLVGQGKFVLYAVRSLSLGNVSCFL